MNIDSTVRTGIVIDHITAGRAMLLYELLDLGNEEGSVAIIKNVHSGKMGKKDIIKIETERDLNLDIIGYVDPGATVNVIRDGCLIEKKTLDLPETLTDVIFCKNPRCITSVEQELSHVFRLTDKQNKVYRCLYCETQAKQ
ncbi:MAG: aspartate carbamoyltransferase regulatory subunit [Ruminococcaceae bacterium]|nr:aspartate carbamoyltransferase regulatory subunit [Oscillospiraceae bacterium]